ncbi:ferredoxin [uncultured Sulfitobacter sp.]|uniref:ferredoxin n=1 Tax=uncultured Sulfitobacter sp. TaxID=191468 RepID=UPI00261BC108|nr:ferredoxin [uncultured Sulfitobacter sp.]
MTRLRTAPEKQARKLLDKVEALAAPHGLMAMGGAHTDIDQKPQTVVLVGTAPEFWDHFIQSHEHSDGLADPIDRWSQRILPQIMEAAGGIAVVYPFGGPPYAPFISWAKKTGEAFDSPTGMLVHIRAGLMISYRGGIVFAGRQPLPAQRPQNPCDSCVGRPCIPACPVNALSDQHFYDVPTCKTYINSAAGAGCVTNGCATRLACPISQTFGRPQAQSAAHMHVFKGV